MNERRLVITIDCDDVLVPTAYKVLDHYKDEFGHEVDPALFYIGTAQDWGLSDLKHVNRRIEQYFRSKKFHHESRTPYPEATIAIPALARHHELHLVTGRGKFMEKSTAELIDEYFPDCFASLIHTNYFKKRFRMTKGQVCKDLAADVHIDDHVEHCHSVLDAGVEGAILFGEYPWNRTVKRRRGLARCINWDATVRKVDQIAAG